MACLTYRISTLGCRVNHAEARDLASVLESRGLQPALTDQPADLEVVHTCSVTNAAAAKSRNAVRRAMRRLPRAGINPANGFRKHAASSSDSQFHVRTTEAVAGVIATGCFAATDQDDVARLIGSDSVIPPENGCGTPLVDRFAQHVDRWLAQRPHPQPTIRHAAASSSRSAVTKSGNPMRRQRHGNSITPLPVVQPLERTGTHIRAELRIQDGCDAHCTFCIIPRIRPHLRSKTIADAVTEARMLVDRGHLEIVLTGIFIGAYGHETALRRRQLDRSSHHLADLLDAIAQVPGLERLRISSMEPGDVTAPLLDAMAANRPVVVPHLHLPLQSGSDRVLRRMNRQYRVGAYLDMAEAVNESLTISEPGFAPLPPAITTDIICGFPGETEEDFQQTVDIARRLGFLHMHLFPFSPRPGTAATRWTDQFVPERIRKQRLRTLREMELDPVNGLAVRFHRRLVGRTVRVITERSDRTTRNGKITGRTDHYAPVHFPTKARRGSVVMVRIDRATTAGLSGEVVEARHRLPVLTT